MVSSYAIALLGFVDKRTKYTTCIVLLFGSMSIHGEEHRFHEDSPDIDFSLVELKKK